MFQFLTEALIHFGDDQAGNILRRLLFRFRRELDGLPIAGLQIL